MQGIARLVTLIAAGLAVAMPAHAQSQQYPARPVRIVVPSSAGGTQDTLARLLAPRLGQMWGQPWSSRTAAAPAA